jgi:arsenate reductase
MAEGYLNAHSPDHYTAFSAGTEPGVLDPYSIQVMMEIGIDISAQRSKLLSEFVGREMDIVITVCDTSRQTCPVFPWTKEMLHVDFPDPARAVGSDEEIREEYRKVRDAIVRWIELHLIGISSEQ